MSKLRKTSMDEKAANEGDRLKHPLTLELPGRCSAWESLTYAETHAGAGRYLASGQLADKPHIARLHDKVSREKRPAVDSEAGGRYLALLRDWWDDLNTVGAYPGSVLQSARFLSRWRSVGSWEIRATEADKATSERLSASLKGLGIETKHEGFQTQVDWLTQNDNLILLVDPYSYFAIDDGEGRDKARTKALNKGRIDQEAMDSLFDRCWGKSACVVLFWCAFAHEPGA